MADNSIPVDHTMRSLLTWRKYRHTPPLDASDRDWRLYVVYVTGTLRREVRAMGRDLARLAADLEGRRELDTEATGALKRRLREIADGVRVLRVDVDGLIAREPLDEDDEAAPDAAGGEPA